MGTSRGKSLVFMLPALTSMGVTVAAEILFTDCVRAHLEKDGIEQREDGLHFDRVLAWMATLQSNKMCWVLVQFVTSFTTQ
jgi:adenylylsulfate kinase-like enzyme